jgi:hypothetical protein
MHEGGEPQPIGAIFDTNSSGRFDLVIYDDGLLAVKGTYVGVALRAAGPGMVGVGAGGLEGAVAAGTGASAAYAGSSAFEARRLARVLGVPRAELADQEPNCFVPREALVGLVLRKRWYGHSLTVLTNNDSAGRRFDWKPKLNNFAQVREVLASTFPGLVSSS